jgi:hypothetical protein
MMPAGSTPASSRRARLAIMTGAAAVVLTAAGAGAVHLTRTPTQAAATAGVPTAAHGAFDAVPRVVFRNTAPGDLYGRVAIAALDDPAGPRDVTPAVCDRVDAVPGSASCLRTEAGTDTTFSASLLDSSWHVTDTWPLPGVPSRTRLSDDGKRVSTTAFVTGHAYATTGFSTATVIHALGGMLGPLDLGNLEEYTLLVDGVPVAPADRNMWGVTFASGSTFYATAQSVSLGHTWLVHGDTRTRTLTTVAAGVECPSLSPDGTRIAFKSDTVPGPGILWTPAVLDLATGSVTLLAGEKHSIDDQIEWLDDHTILYGLPRTDQPGVTDVWSLAVDPAAVPQVFIPQAWSPAVIRQD